MREDLKKIQELLQGSEDLRTHLKAIIADCVIYEDTDDEECSWNLAASVLDVIIYDK